MQTIQTLSTKEIEHLYERIERLFEEIDIEIKSGKPNHTVITQNKKSIINISNWIAEDINNKKFTRHE